MTRARSARQGGALAAQRPPHSRASVGATTPTSAMLPIVPSPTSTSWLADVDHTYRLDLSRLIRANQAMPRNKLGGKWGYRDRDAMDTKGKPDPEQLLLQARQGHRESLGRLLELYRNYLALLTRTQIDLHLRVRVDASDLVQETFLDVCRDFGQFRGSSEIEWVAWLRKVLVYNLARVVQRQVLAQKRNPRREVSLEQHLAVLDRSSARIEAALIGRC